MSASFAISAQRVFDGEAWHDHAAVLVRDGRCDGVVSASAVPGDLRYAGSVKGLLVPGFVDLQVNGGGGVMLNDRQDVEAIRTICAAHAPYGTTALLVTLITDTPQATAAAIRAGAEAAQRQIPGFAGLHLEGPHLSRARKGAHDPALIRPMTDADLDALAGAATVLSTLLTTVAPESVSPEQVAALAGHGVIVSLGHTDAGHLQAAACYDAGATLATHLFNAMSQIGNREPGLAGTAIRRPDVSAGLIADGIHVHPETMAVALAAKRAPGHVFLVSDAMAPLGTDMDRFTLNGRTILRHDGRLTLEDGTLAGADLDMISAVCFVHRSLGMPLDEALRMASLYPAKAIGRDAEFGRLVAGTRADMLHLSDDLDVRAVWIGGEQVFDAS